MKTNMYMNSTVQMNINNYKSVTIENAEYNFNK